MQESSKEVVAGILNHERPSRILDAPSGSGWLAQRLAYPAQVVGIDLYAGFVPGYEKIHCFDLNQGLPADLGVFDCCCCCEGIEHLGNPLLFFEHMHKALKVNGLLVITTPNVWYPAAKAQYLMRGFFPSFPNLVGKLHPGSHQHIMPWSFPQLNLYLSLTGFAQIQLHKEPLSQCKYLWERVLGFPQYWYCRSKQRHAKTEEEKEFWEQAGSPASALGRHLIVSARKIQTANHPGGPR